MTCDPVIATPAQSNAPCRAGRARAWLRSCLLVTVGLQSADWTPAEPGYRWAFPRDHWAHEGYKTEWWYFTGSLAATDDPARRFGYQFTFFRVGMTPQPVRRESAWSATDLIMGHAAITDLSTGRYVFSEVLYRAAEFLGGFGDPADSMVAWSRAPPGTDAVWSLTWNGEGFDFSARDVTEGFALTLSTRPAKPLVLHGDRGFSRKGSGPTSASLYYSYPRLATVGRIETAGRVTAVRGESWMDHEFGSNQLGEQQTGWDWFGLRLDDGRELMLYQLRNEDGAVDYAGGTAVAPNGAARPLTGFTVASRSTWRSPATGAEYPNRWRVTVPSERLELEIVPQIADQEFRARLVPDLFYWEGAVTVLGIGGSRLGEGYVELTGYGTRSRPAI